MSIKKNLLNLKSKLPHNISLVAVSKTKPISDLEQAYQTGQRLFGENKVQEMVHKYEIMPKDIKWHMIGHLQRNKVKYIAPFVNLIHGVDSLKLLKEISKQALKCDRTIDCLFQLKIASENTKFGMSKNELQTILNCDEFKKLKYIKGRGVMGMASFTGDFDKIKLEFKYLKSIFDDLKNQFQEFKIISMGMSGDYELAIKCGSNMIRIGSHIFGSR